MCKLVKRCRGWRGSFCSAKDRQLGKGASLFLLFWIGWVVVPILVGAAMLSVFTTAAVILLRKRIWMICCPNDLCHEFFCMIGNQRIFILSATFTQKLENFVWVITGKYLFHVFFDGHLLPLFGGSGSTALWAATGKPARRPAVASTMGTEELGLHFASEIRLRSSSSVHQLW